MFERVLQGYEKAFDTVNILSYTPALNTIWAVASLFRKQGNLPVARTMYLKARLGYEKVVGSGHPTSQSLQEIFQGLDSRTEKGRSRDINLFRICHYPPTHS
jgi:hypothetical protein